MTKKRKTKSFKLIWRGITLKVIFEPDWTGASERESEFVTDHIEVHLVEPEWEILPITETGYRSHFLDPDDVTAAGGAYEAQPLIAAALVQCGTSAKRVLAAS